MREILFRGKRADNGKWVEGCFCDKTCKTMFSKAEPSAQIIDNNLFWYDVDPETVGQFTGMNDRVNDKIFEGDILFDPYSELYGSVTYNEDDGMFDFIVDVDDDYDFADIDSEDFEIVGNIHDNPELLKGGGT